MSADSRLKARMRRFRIDIFDVFIRVSVVE